MIYQIHIICPIIYRQKAREIYANYLREIGEDAKRPLETRLRPADGTAITHIYAFRNENEEGLKRLQGFFKRTSEDIPWVSPEIYEPSADDDEVKNLFCLVIGLPLVVLGCFDLAIAD